jgi:hypothetical protein
LRRRRKPSAFLQGDLVAIRLADEQIESRIGRLEIAGWFAGANTMWREWLASVPERRHEREI